MAESSISSFIEVLRATGWTKSLFLQFNRCFQEWARKKGMGTSASFNTASSTDFPLQSWISNQDIESQTRTDQYCIRDGKALNMKLMEKEIMIPICMYTTLIVKQKASNPSSIQK